MLEELADDIQMKFGIQPGLTAAAVPAGLPILYKAMFRLYRGTLARHVCLFVLDRSRIHLTPGRIRRNLAVLQGHFPMPVVYVGDLSCPHGLERLLAMHVPFIVPGRYLYLPFLGAVFDTRRKVPSIQRDHICLCAQLIITGTLLRCLEQPVRAAELVGKLPFGRSAVLAAFEEIERFGLGRRRPVPRGREMTLQFTAGGRDLWEEGRRCFRNPVKRTVGLQVLPEEWNAVAAGEDALAERSRLSEKPATTFAMELSRFRRLDPPAIPARQAELKLQLWLYPPCLFGKDRIDPLSLALSLHDHPDDRVQIALEECLKGFPW